MRYEVFTINDETLTVRNSWIHRLKSGVYITAAEKYVETYEK